MTKRVCSFLSLLILIGLFLNGCTKVHDAGHDAENRRKGVTGMSDNLTEDRYKDGGNNTSEADGMNGEDHFDPKFELLLEAEDVAITTGKVRPESTYPDFSGNGYLVGIEREEDTVTFNVSVPGSGFYDLNFISASCDGYKENNVYVNGEFVGVAKVERTNFQDSILKRVYLKAGKNEIKLTKSWGWIRLDALKITASPPIDQDIYKISAQLVDLYATDRAKKLMQFLVDMYGKYIISGQYSDKGINGPEFKAIYSATGKYPAILGLDFIDYTPSRVAHGTNSKAVEYAIEFDKLGGIVTFCWHWNAPEPYLYDTSEKPWWSGFYTRATNINLEAIMNGKDPQGYELLLRDIDEIAKQLKRLQEADVPILWRPLHEASGGWFWWGASGPDAYIKLYRLLFDRLTKVHGIHNLIWVWNGQHPAWYPGDKYVDIIGMDIYPGERVYSPHTSKFFEMAKWPTGKRIIALTENGCLFDPDLAFRDGAVWSHFCTWNGDFVWSGYGLSEKYTERYMFEKVYNHEKVLTLDELPDLRSYGQ